jgi:Leucine-rich repeat (LRR) protein
MSHNAKIAQPGKTLSFLHRYHKVTRGDWRLDSLEFISVDLYAHQISSSFNWKLCNLKRLGVAGTYMKKLPEEIGNLSNLERINSYCSSIESLPASFGRLNVCLRGLSQRETSIPEIRGNDPHDLLWKLVREFPLLGHLSGGHQQLQIALACNRARSRINFDPTMTRNAIR